MIGSSNALDEIPVSLFRKERSGRFSRRGGLSGMEVDVLVYEYTRGSAKVVCTDPQGSI